MQGVSHSWDLQRAQGKSYANPAPPRPSGNSAGTRQFLTHLWSAASPLTTLQGSRMLKYFSINCRISGSKIPQIPVHCCSASTPDLGTWNTKFQTHSKTEQVMRWCHTRRKNKKECLEKTCTGSSSLNKQAAKCVKSSNPFACLKYCSLDGSSQSTACAVYPPQMTPDKMSQVICRMYWLERI